MHSITRTKIIAIASVLVPPAAVAAATAQQFPGSKPIEMTVLLAAGSAVDITARHLADGMARELAAPVPVVNRTGGGGAIGYSFVKHQRPDGHSIIWNSNSISITYHGGMLPFDYTAFDAVARVSVETPALAVRADAPWKTLADLIEYAKANPSKVRIGNSGISSHTHFAESALFIGAGAKVTDVPFGEGQALVNLLGQRVEGIVQLPAAVVSYVKSGELRVLAMLGSKRDPIFPDAPTATELGFPVVLDMWRGIAAPKGTPKPVIAKLEAAVKQSVESQAFKEVGDAIGFTPAFLPAADFTKLIANDDRRLGEVMADLGLKKSK